MRAMRNAMGTHKSASRQRLIGHCWRVFQDRPIQLDLDTCFGLFSPTETLLPILSFIREW
jgi:hypothetical protein